MNRPPRKKRPGAPNEPTIDADYTAAIRGLAQDFRAWIEAHPQASPLIQFNYTKKVMVIATITDAIDKHHVTVNADGRAMIEACCHIGQCDELSVFMVRFAIEHLDEMAPPRPS